jgi:hypothetical protein
MSAIRLSEIVEWIYHRGEGDIVVYARTAQEAAFTIRGHGFLVVDMKKIKRGESRLTHHLKKDGIS